MNENNNFDYMNTMFGIQDWRSGDEKYDNECIEDMLKYLKDICFEMNAAQMKSFLITLMSEIDKRAKI